MNENPVDKQFSKISDKIFEKLDNFVIDLEKELLVALRKKYPKHKATIDSLTCLNSHSTNNLAPNQNQVTIILVKIIFIINKKCPIFHILCYKDFNLITYFKINLKVFLNFIFVD